ncbi:Endonuclease/Exonuclease/phosphatase family protein [Prauserella aidingensis]|uniref:endonuclease/exonuclease/phosphatase family protein n=1 Tax=Prauserella aidingensis TaxID=387890 RepID=UPI0020A54B88|nr:endonuclease/exonuclease/phosphatase family protein [Prauserella aidingensis]MCP2253837.1 Endonuclease/Exonuclease/phosphatase family protein [Prauserella aidingensis]
MRIGTWNLENLFRPGTGDGPPTKSEYDEKLDGLAEMIGTLGPEVLSVQEIGDPEALDDLEQRLDDLEQRLDGTWRTELAEPDGRGIRVGFLSKRALTRVEKFSAFPAELGGARVDDGGERIAATGRPALRVRVRAGGRSIDVVAAHLKSKLLTYPGGRFTPRDEGERARYAVYALHRRAAEAATVRAEVDALLDGDGTDRAVVVAGDLNDEPQAATTQILLGPGGSEFGTAGYERSDKGDAHRLWNVAPLIPEQQRYSRVYRGRRELIDHLLVSHALADAVTEVTTGDGDSPSVTDQPGDRRDVTASDHRPVVMTVKL